LVKNKKNKMEKFTIKDIFSGDENENKSSSKDQRMVDLNKALDEKKEVYLKENKKTIDSEALLKETDRFKKIAKLDESNVAQTHPQGGLKRSGPGLNNPTLGTTVANFMGDMPGKSVNTFLENPNLYLANKNYNPNYTYLQPNEALRLSISRTLTSGAPIAEMSFYDEVNWNLNNLGFDSKSPLDIKQTIFKMIKD
jgi:hypothetical protein